MIIVFAKYMVSLEINRYNENVLLQFKALKPEQIKIQKALMSMATLETCSDLSIGCIQILRLSLFPCKSMVWSTMLKFKI